MKNKQGYLLTYSQFLEEISFIIIQSQLVFNFLIYNKLKIK